MREREELWTSLESGAGLEIKNRVGKNDARLKGVGGAWEGRGRSCGERAGPIRDNGRDRRKGKKLGKSKGEVLEKRYGSERRGWFGAGGCERACVW